LAETQICKQGAAHLDKNLEVEAHISASVLHRVWKQYDERSGSKDVWANSERVVKQVSWMSDWQQW
jgi:hypothetical protein